MIYQVIYWLGVIDNDEDNIDETTQGDKEFEDHGNKEFEEEEPLLEGGDDVDDVVSSSPTPPIVNTTTRENRLEKFQVST